MKSGIRKIVILLILFFALSVIANAQYLNWTHLKPGETTWKEYSPGASFDDYWIGDTLVSCEPPFINKTLVVGDRNMSPIDSEVDEDGILWALFYDESAWFINKPSMYLGKYEMESWTFYPIEYEIYLGQIECFNDQVWIAATKLVVFDGESFTELNSTNSEYDAEKCNSIIKGANDDLWIGTDNGFYNYNGTEWTHFLDTSFLDFFEYSIQDMVIRDNEVWGVSYYGLVKLEEGVFTVFDESFNDVFQSNYAIDKDYEGKFWIGGENFFSFDGTSIINVVNTDTLGSYFVSDIKCDDLNRIWINANGLSYWNDTNWTVYQDINTELPEGGCRSMYYFDSVLFVNNACGQISEININTLDIFNIEQEINSIVRLPVRDFDFNFIGDITFAYDSSDYSPITFSTLTGDEWNHWSMQEKGTNSSCARKVKYDKNDELWVVTLSEIIHETVDTSYIFNGSNLPYYIFGFPDIEFDSQNDMWIPSGHLTYGGLIHHYDDEWEKFDSSNSPLITNNIHQIEIDGNDKIWMIAWEGNWWWDNNYLISKEMDDWMVYDTSYFNGEFCKIISIEIDQYNFIWFGTDNGLYKFDGVNYTSYNQENSNVPSKGIAKLAFDRNGKLWAITNNPENYLEKYLTYFEDGLFTVVYDSINFPELENLGIFSMGFDLNNNLCLGTDKGFYRSNSNSFDIPEIDLGQVNVYPNPVIDESQVIFNNDKRESHLVTIFDYSGKIVMQDEINNGRYIFNCRSLAAGVYLCRVKNMVNEKTLDTKFVVVK